MGVGTVVLKAQGKMWVLRIKNVSTHGVGAIIGRSVCYWVSSGMKRATMVTRCGMLEIQLGKEGVHKVQWQQSAQGSGLRRVRRATVCVGAIAAAAAGMEC